MPTTEDKTKKVLTTIAVPVEITEQRIEDLLCGAFDGQYGSSYSWAGIQGYEYPAGKSKADFTYKAMEVALAGGKMFLFNVEDGDESNKEYDAEKKEKYTLTREKLIKGLEVMAALPKGKGGHHFRDFVNENDDAITSDVFVQCCIFGEIVYG